MSWCVPFLNFRPVPPRSKHLLWQLVTLINYLFEMLWLLSTMHTISTFYSPVLFRFCSLTCFKLLNWHYLVWKKFPFSSSPEFAQWFTTTWPSPSLQHHWPSTLSLSHLLAISLRKGSWQPIEELFASDAATALTLALNWFSFLFIKLSCTYTRMASNHINSNTHVQLIWHLHLL